MGRWQKGAKEEKPFTLEPCLMNLSYTGDAPVLHCPVVGCTCDALGPLVNRSNLHSLYCGDKKKASKSVEYSVGILRGHRL